MTLTPSRDEEIRLIWKENQWLYMVVGFIAGLLFCLLTQLSVLNLPELVQNLLPEAASILVTITVIDQLNRRRDARNAIKQLQEQLVRDASSIVNDVANNAVHQLRKREWLQGDNGLLAREHLEAANLQGVVLRGANLQGTYLYKANLQGTYLGYTNLQGAFLGYANLQGADLSVANLQRTNLSVANLQRAILWEANLRGACLVGANLQRAYLVGANLQETDLNSANLQGVELTVAQFDENTILPDGSRWKPGTDMTRFTQPDNQAGSPSNDEAQ